MPDPGIMFDGDGFAYDPCWDCPFFDGACHKPVGEHCLDDELDVLFHHVEDMNEIGNFN